MRQPRGGRVPPKVAPPPHAVPRPGGGGSTGAPGKGHKRAPRPKPPPKPKKTPPHKKPRGWSPGSDVACCSAEALGTLVIASGSPWSHEETLALYWSTASDPDAGATILDTLTAGRARGWLSCVPLAMQYPSSPGPRLPSCALSLPAGLSVILGVSLPEPHAVAVTPDGRWWSWGEPFRPGDWPGLVIEEAWCLP